MYLSESQETILTMALDRSSNRLWMEKIVRQNEILKEYYGFKPSPRYRHCRGRCFSKQEIGFNRYNAASVALCKAYNRLERKELVERHITPSGVSLTNKGKIVARKLRKQTG